MIRSERLASAMGEWECMECGFIEEGTEAKRPKRCAECGAPASALEFFPYDDDADWRQVESEDLFEEEFEDEEFEDLEEDEFEDEER